MYLYIRNIQCANTENCIYAPFSGSSNHRYRCAPCHIMQNNCIKITDIFCSVICSI